ncbi:GntR family transcriptional regulator [Allobaculum sp. Allo2]|nr:GntR family transcriptional regulator [Allobaculum sp. Allo2]UNT92476.1 GntR family transcriptional regulator [Allobaculum sp. Allo2]
MLVMEGLIYRKQGQGSFVLSSKINRPEVEIQERELVGFTKATNGEGTSKVLRFQLMFATEKIAKALNIHVNDPVYDICRVRLLNDRPYVIEQTYMSPAVIPGLTLDILNHSIYSYIENDLGLRIGAAQKTTSADISNETDHKELGLSEVEPVLVVEQIAFLDNGVPFEYSISRHRYDLFRFSVYSIRR